MRMIRVLAACILCASIAPGALEAQRGDAPRTSDSSPGPLAISGNPSSARHCVSGAAANIHSLGWVTSGTGYTITFDSDISLTTSAARMNLEEDDAIAVHGTPEINFTASTSGTMALFVSGSGRAGCYRYKVQIDPPAAGAASVSTRATALQSRLVKATKPDFGALAITGAASSAKHCAAGDGVARVHALGYADEGARVTVTFASDFDPIAGVVVIDPIGQGGSYFIDDDSGGGTQPEISFTTSRSGNLALMVAGYGGATGCYRYQASIEAGGGGEAPLTLSEVAAPLAEAVASEIAAALESGTISEASLGPQGFGTLAIASRNCRRAGTVRVSGVTRSGNRYSMSGATATFAGCTFVAGRRAVAINAALALSGQWCPGQGTGTCSQVTVSGAVPIPGLPAPAPLEGSIGITSFAINVTGAGIQQGAPDTQPTPNPNSCPATLTAAPTIPAAGGAFAITIAVGATCPWTASSSSGFITITAGTSGRGPGAATFRVAANTGAARQGTVTVNGQSVRVNQLAGTTPPPPPGGRFDGTYDFTFVSPAGGGQTNTQTIPRFFVVTNGRIRSTDGAFSGAVTNSTSGTVQFTGPCWTSSGGTATFTGAFVAGTPKSGSGSYTCQNGILGRTWSVANGR